jgi:hypothetical protein
LARFSRPPVCCGMVASAVADTPVNERLVMKLMTPATASVP